MKTAYPILQSGFLARSEVGYAKIPQPEENKIIRAIELGKPFDSNGNPFFYDPALDETIKAFMIDPRKMRSFEFREQFLKQFKNAFAFGHLGDWIRFQENSPYFSRMHRDFINDSVSFMSKGRRDVSIESWQGLIYPRLKTQEDLAIPFNEDVKYFLNEFNLPFAEMVCRWTAHQNGWQDLITFVGIVYTTLSSCSV